MTNTILYFLFTTDKVSQTARSEISGTIFSINFKVLSGSFL